MDNAIDQALAVATMATASYHKGMQMGADFERRKFEVVIQAYDRALKDQSVVMPTYLHMALENARSEIEKAQRRQEAA